MRIRGQAARSIGLSASFWVRLCHPFTLRIVIWPEASSAQNNIVAVSADGSAVWVLIRRLNSSWSRSIGLVVREPFDRVGGASALPLAGRQPGEGKEPILGHAFPPPCPQVGGFPQASQHPAALQPISLIALLATLVLLF